MQGYGAAPPRAGGEYEFTQDQNDVFEDLAKKMRFVGLMGILFGVLSLAGAIAGIAVGNGSVAGPTLIQAIMLLVVGIWTRTAAEGFQRIVDTQGNDIANLMHALGELRRIYALQRTIFIVGIVLLFLGIQLAILMYVRGR